MIHPTGINWGAVTKPNGGLVALGSKDVPQLLQECNEFATIEVMGV
jgi:hypothetical protein